MKALTATLLLIVTLPALAQTSASFELEEHVFNAGGRPENGTIVSSSSFKVTLDAIGDSVGARALASPSFRLGSGFVGSYPPPGEVTGLLFDDRESLRWDPEPSAGVYNLYRDLMSAVSALGYGSCSQQSLAQPSATDGDSLPDGEGYFYLVTVSNALDEEGTKGSRSSGAQRLGDVCP